MFVSLYFVLFILITWLIYGIIPRSCRVAFLLFVSYAFCAFISVEALLILTLSTVIIYVGAIGIEKNREKPLMKKRIAGSTIFLFAFVLIVVKNIPYVIKMFNIGFIEQDSFLRSIALPVGFSFYAFSAIGYIYDVYRGREEAEANLFSVALFFGFFAKLVSGPIERKEKFIDQVKNIRNVKFFEKDRLIRALTFLAWGYFLKLVIADRLAVIVNQIYSGYDAYDSVWLFINAVFYSFQIYADFYGYTCIAIGCALIFGIELSQNFNSPYVALNITEFWRRWHISLSTWLRDYLYIPLGGNRKGKVRKCINTMIVFLVCGIWHGNGLSFIVWGLLHGTFSVFDSLVGKKGTGNAAISCIRRIVTFLAVSFAWIFFRAESLTLALRYISRMFTAGMDFTGKIGIFEQCGGVMVQVYISLALIVLLQVIDIICYRKNTTFPVLMINQGRFTKYLFFYVIIIMIYIFGMYGGEIKAENFIYMQF